MDEISDFERVLTLIFNIIMSIIVGVVQLPFTLLLDFYKAIENIVDSILNAIDIFNNVDNTDIE